MLGTRANMILGGGLYIIGIALANIFFDTAPIASIHIAFELAIISLALLFLSALFYGRFSFLLMLPTGLILGQGFTLHPLALLFGFFPLISAVISGSDMGNNALLDLRGKENFFSKGLQHLKMCIICIVLALVVGYLFSGITLSQLVPENILQFDLVGFFEELSSGVKLI